MLDIGAGLDCGSLDRSVPSLSRPRSPLSWAVLRNNLRSHLLLDAGAKVQASHLYDAVAAHERSPGIRDTILPKLNDSHVHAHILNRNQRNSDCERANEMQKAIEMAITNNRGDVAFALLSELERGGERQQIFATVNKLLHSGDSLLASLASWSDFCCIATDSYGAPVDQRSICVGSISNGNTPLCESANDSIVEILLNAGADPNIQNRDSKATPLHYAARRGDSLMMERLLRAGASVNARTNEGFTPLVEAVRCAPPAGMRRM